MIQSLQYRCHTGRLQVFNPPLGKVEEENLLESCQFGKGQSIPVRGDLGAALNLTCDQGFFEEDKGPEVQ